MILSKRSFAIVFFCLLSLLLASCGGLSSEPEIVRTAALPTVTPTPPPDLGRPAERVSIARGAAIYHGAQGCTLCHGPAGKGDGPVAANMTCKLPDFSDPQMARSKSIGNWFAITTNGNNGAQGCLMPPWKTRLDEQQRWDVSSYIYALHYTPDLLAQGQKIWQEKCAACHGERGAGDGPQATGLARPVPNLIDPVALIPRSDTDLWQVVTNGIPPAMPAYQNELDENARWAVVAYMRSLSWASAEQIASAATPSPTPTPAATPTDGPTVTVSGKVTNGTSGAAAPANLALTLRVIELGGQTPRNVEELKATTGADGSFSFGAVQRRNGLVYVVTAQYAGLLQTSEPVRLQPGSGGSLDLSFRVFEATADSTVLQIAAEQIVLQPFSQTQLRVLQRLDFRNTGDRAFLMDRKTASGERISMEIPLPAGAQQIALSEDIAQRFVIEADGDRSVVRGIVPVVPGEAAALQLSYLLPSLGRTPIPVLAPYPVESLTIYIPQASGLTIQESIYVQGQPLQLQDGIYNAYSLQRLIRAGERLVFTVLSQGEQAADRRNVLALVFTLALILIVGTVLAIWRLNQQGAAASVSQFDSLIQSIANLDERFEKGQMPQNEYESERARLKSELAKLMSG
jgi:mono/diheme cytochrome c family protein